jgi:hypothetical protein
VRAGYYDEALLRVADRLCAELGGPGGGGLPSGVATLSTKTALPGTLSHQDELLLSGLRLGLARISAAAGDSADDFQARAVAIALDGVEMVMLGKLLGGNGAELPRLMPGFVFLVTLPIVDQDRALELSRRTERLIDEELRAWDR